MWRYVKREAGLWRIPLLVVVLSGSAVACEPAGGPGDIDGGSDRAEAELAHGRYLVDNVLLCFNCHSQRDWSLYSGPIVPGGERRGGEVDLFLDPTAAPDISPRALRTWSEDDLVAALVQGRDRDGRPFHQRWMLGNFADLATADAIAVARYLLADASSEIPARSSGGATGAARGAYLVSLGRCELCHGEDLGGGSAVAVPGGESLPAANISLDVETGVGRLSREEFIDYFKSLSGPEFQRVEVPPDTPNTAMPWPQFSQMTRDDLGSIYDHLATRAPVRRPVPAP